MSRTKTVAPTGVKHDVGVEDMFFSTTDAKGVIDQANEVFVRIARHPREELAGAPHNIIRHPQMPGGAFKIVWDLLEAGRPACAYVLNLAGDGSSYWAMASIVPIAGGYLSVRTRPAREDLRDAAWGLYESARVAEDCARDSGASAAEAATTGATVLGEGLAGLGFSSYEQFMRAMLPAELAARGTQVGAVPTRSDAPVGLRFTLDAIADVDARVRSLGVDLGRFAGDADSLDAQLKATQQALHALEGCVHDAAGTARELDERAPLLAKAAPVVEDKCAAIAAAIDEMAQTVSDLATSRADLSFQVALAQLQAEMAGRFVVAVIDRTESLDTSDRAVHTLAAALEHEMTAVSAGIERNLAATRAVRERLDGSRSSLRILGMSLSTWRDLVVKYGVQAELDHLLPALDAALATTTGRIAELASTLDSFGQLTVAFDNASLQQQLRSGLLMLESTAG